MKKKIIIADDDNSILDVLKITLQRAGYQTVAMHDGKALLAHIPESTDLILLDILMSGTNGLDICRQLKSNSISSHIPIVLVSAVPDLEHLAEEVAADGFLQKPFGINQLLKVIDQHIK